MTQPSIVGSARISAVSTQCQCKGYSFDEFFTNGYKVYSVGGRSSGSGQQASHISSENAEGDFSMCKPRTRSRSPVSPISVRAKATGATISASPPKAKGTKETSSCTNGVWTSCRLLLLLLVRFCRIFEVLHSKMLSKTIRRRKL